MKLPRNLDDLVETGRTNLEGLVGEGRKGAQRLYSDGRDWLDDHLPDARQARRAAGRGRDQARDVGRDALHRAAADDRLRAPVRWIEAHLPEPRRSSSVLWPSVLAAAGAGVAFWWWTSWSRGRAESAERAALDAAGGEAGRAHPESVMAHAAEPAAAGDATPDTSASKLSAPAETVMAHAPAPAADAAPAKPSAAKATADEARLLASTAAAGLVGGVEGVAPAAAVKSLDESLAVQGAAPKPNGRRPGGAAA